MSSAERRSALQRWFIRGWASRGLQAWLLWPLAALFGALSALRRGLYRIGLFKTGGVRVPVIVVGNVIIGGSGKTPVVIALVRHLQTRGLQVGVISRGHGRGSRNSLEVLSSSTAFEVGDEPALIQSATKAPVFVAARRIDAARALLVAHPETQVIVSDDGLQHLGLQRDLEICVFDDRGTGNGFLLPAGPLREHWPRAADWALHTGALPAFAGFRATRALAQHAVRADGSQVALARLAQADAKPRLAVAAIAKPEDFFNMHRAQGLTLERTIALPDHDDFAHWETQDQAAYTVLCTEKDALKLWPRQGDALAVPLLVTLEPGFLTQVDDRLAALLTLRLAPTLSSGHGHTTS